MVVDQRIHDLKRVPLFADCPGRELDFVARLTDELRFEAGTFLTREGRTGHECFVIAEGEAIVTIGGQRIARVGPGDIVGEMALLEQEPRVASVMCATDVRAFVLTAQAFASLLDHCPTVGRKVLATVAHRLREIQAA